MADGVLTVYSGHCPACGRDRSFRFLMPRPIVTTGFGPQAPSSIVDPGEFLWASTAWVNEVPALPEDVEPEALPKAVRTMAQSVAMVEQVLSFVPAGTSAVPASAFTSELGRAIFRSNPEWFERDQLLALLTERRDQLAAYEGRLAHVDKSRMRIPLARSLDEISLYHELHPCECGQAGLVQERVSWSLVDGAEVGRSHNRCAGCGKLREFQFRLADDHIEQGLRFGRFGGATRSELIDAGEWRWVSSLIASRNPAYITHLTPEQQQQAKTDLGIAIAALEEVLKFIPRGATEVPPEAFWTVRGRQDRADGRVHFRRDMIEAVLAAYRKLYH